MKKSETVLTGTGALVSELLDLEELSGVVDVVAVVGTLGHI